MQTRREQLQAYQFLVRRILAALLGNEPEAPEQPMRRAKVATFSGVMVGALACGGVALVGFLTHSSSQGWQDSTGSIIVDKDTKQKFYYADLGGRKTLFPIVNYTSAQLLLRESEPTLKEVPPENLAGVPRGPEAGIPGIPDAFPAAESVTDGPWLACNHMPSTTSRLVELFVDHQPPNDSTSLNGSQAVVINDDAGQQYLVSQGTRFAVDDDVLNSLSIDPEQSVRVAPAWLNLLPQGEELAARPPEGAGTQRGIEVDTQQTLVGQVFYSSSNDTYWVMYSDGLARTTETQARLLLGAGSLSPTGVQQDATGISAAAANNAASQTVSSMPLPEGQPNAIPKAFEASDRSPLCLTYDPGDPEAELGISVGGQVPHSNAVQAVGGQSTGLAANRVTVTGGAAAVIAPLGANGEPSGRAIVADNGLKYPVPNQDVLGYVGYGGVTPLQVPKPFADLIKAGPALDPDAAMNSALQQASN